jgi:hypothetical protein
MSQNPKKPVISELDDADLGLTLGEWDDWSDGYVEDQCSECFGAGTIDHDDSGDEDECHVCGGTGYVTYLP